MRYLPVFLYLLSYWMLMEFAAFFVPWFELPDIIVLAIVYLHYFCPSVPLWRFIFPIALLADFSGQVVWGFHGVLYALSAVIIFPLNGYWQIATTVEQIIGVVLLGIGFQAIRFLLLYLCLNIPAPAHWYWTTIAQIALLIPVCFITEIFSERFLAREIA